MSATQAAVGDAAPAPGVSGVVVAGLVVEYRRGPETVRPLDDLTFAVDAGRLVLLLGPSGSGKTTLLSCLAGILTPAQGSITAFGTDVTAASPAELMTYRRRGVGIVFQGFNLVPSLTAAENVAAPLWAAGVRRRPAAARAAELLADLAMSDRAHHRPAELSGGQQQRVAIARALVADPPLLLADEPTAHLDHVQAEAVLRILRDLANRGRTVLVSTHDTRLLPLADAMVTLTREALVTDHPSEEVRLRDGATIFREGDAADDVYVVVRGAVLLERSGPDGESEEVARCGPGDYFGELGPLLGFPRSATARAVGATRLERMSVSTFRKRFGGSRPTSWGQLAVTDEPSPRRTRSRKQPGR